MVRIIQLNPEQWAKLPYKSTKISKGRTKGEIIGLLEDNGIGDYQWTKIGQSETLAFRMAVTHEGVEYDLGFKFEPAMLYKRVGRKTNYRYELQEAISWRMFYWLLKSKLEAVQFGLEEAYQVLASNIINRLPDGSETTLGESLAQMLKTGELAGPALEHKPKESEEIPRVIEADYKVQEE